VIEDLLIDKNPEASSRPTSWSRRNVLQELMHTSCCGAGTCRTFGERCFREEPACASCSARVRFSEDLDFLLKTPNPTSGGVHRASRSRVVRAGRHPVRAAGSSEADAAVKRAFLKRPTPSASDTSGTALQPVTSRSGSGSS